MLLVWQSSCRSLGWVVPRIGGSIENGARVKRLFLATLFLLSCLGILSVTYAVPHLAAGIWDSVVYIGTARSLAQGSGFYVQGWLPRLPLTHWPPLYPVLLAVPAHFGIDPTVSAKWIDGFFLSCSIFLVGLITWANCGRSYVLGILAALAIAFSPDIIEIHSQVLSEAPFIAFVLAGIALLLAYADSGRKKYLIGLALALSAAMLTRYAGVFFLIAVYLVIAVNWRNLKERSISVLGSAVALAAAAAPLGIWILRNRQLNGSPVGQRKFAFHPPGRDQLVNLCSTVSKWFAPAVPHALRALVLLGILTAIAFVFVSLFRSTSRTADVIFDSTTLLAEFCLIFDGTYLIFLLLTITFFDAATSFDMRLLLPMFPITVLILISGLATGRRKYGQHSMVYRALLTVGLLIVLSNSVRFWDKIRDIRSNGVGFQTIEWQDNEIMRYLRDLGSDTILYSDNPLLIYYATGRASYEVPDRFLINTYRANDEYAGEIRQLRELGARKDVDIILLETDRNGDEDVAFETAEQLEERLGFHPILRSIRGHCILGSRPESSATESP